MKRVKIACVKHEGFYIYPLSIVNLDGTKYVTDHLRKFCQEFHLDYYAMLRVKDKRAYCHRGWMFSNDLSNSILKLYQERNMPIVKKAVGAPPMNDNIKSIVLAYKDSNLSYRKIAQEIATMTGQKISYVYVYKVLKQC